MRHRSDLLSTHLPIKVKKNSNSVCRDYTGIHIKTEDETK